MKTSAFLFRAAFAAGVSLGAVVASSAAATNCVGDAACEWIDMSTQPVGGRGSFSAEEPFMRLANPLREKAPSASVRAMARQSTGLNFRFRTTSRRLVVHYEIEPRAWTDPLMSPSALQSVSVWGRWKGNADWEYVGKNHPKADGVNEYALSWSPEREGWMYFPTRAVVKSFKVGIDRGATFEVLGYPRPERVVVYGTSIVHGGCVSSGGMMFTSFAGRRVGCEIVNLGFSGGGRMELEMVDVLAEIEAGLYVIDCDWNMKVEMQKERYEPFVRRLRARRPGVPILLCGGCTEKAAPMKQETFARSVYDRLKAEDPVLWRDLHFLSGVDALPKCSWATHDHCHPNDYGAPFMGEVYARRIREILDAARK